MKMIQLTFSVLILFLSFQMAQAQSCNAELQQAIAEFNSSCAGSDNICYAQHPEGYGVPTEFTHSITPVVTMKNDVITGVCVSGSCPEHLYPALGNIGFSRARCSDGPYPPDNSDKSPNNFDQPTNVCGSIVNVETQTVGESIPILGTSFSLTHFSHFTYGRNHNLNVTLTESTSASDTNSFKIKVTSDDGVYVPEFTWTNAPGLKYNFIWDGLDKNGQPVLGSKKFTVSTTQIFNNGTNVLIPIERDVNLGNFHAKLLGLGGWVPSIYKYYNASTGEIYSGDGGVRKVPYVGTLTNDPDGASFYSGNDGDTEVYYFDSEGRHLFTKTSITGKKIFTFNYDSEKRLTSIVEPFGQTTRFERDSNGHLLRIIAPKGSYASGSTPATATSLSSAGLVTLVELNPQGLIANLKTFENPNHSYAMTYSSSGLLLTFKKPGGQVSTFNYNLNGDLIRDSHSGGYFFDLVKTLNGNGDEKITQSTRLGLQTKYETTNNTNGTVTRKTTYPNGQEKEHTFNQETQSIAYGGSIFNSQDISNTRILGSKYNYSSSLSTPAYSQYRSRYVSPVLSDYSDPYSISQIVINESIGMLALTTIYDGPTKTYTTTTPLGKVFSQTIDDYERVISQSVGALTPTSYTYTNENLTKIAQGSRETLFGYNSDTGYLQSITNPLGQTTALQYDSAGRVSMEMTPDLRTTKYSYDGNGNVVEIINPRNISHVFNFNSSELNSSYVAPLAPGSSSYQTSYEYDLDKKLKKTTRPGNEVISYDYLPNTGELNKITTPSGSYDITRDSVTGLPSQIKSPSNLISRFTYSGPVYTKDELLNSQQTVLGQYSRSFMWDKLSQDVVLDQNNAGTYVGYQYDNDINLIQAGDLALSYDTNNQLTGTSIGPVGSEITDTYVYNTMGEVTSYQVQRGMVVIYDLNLQRDALGRITQKTQTMRGQTTVWDYTYDSAGRLINVNKNGAAYSSYVYDANGNRTGGNVGAQTTTATYDAQDRIQGYNLFNYTYKPNGSLYQKKNTLTNYINTYMYDSFGNLKKYYSGDLPAATYEHDGLNRVVGSYSSGVIDRRWIYMDQYRIAAELVPSSNSQKRFVYASKANIPDLMIIGSATYRIISDNLGSPRLLVRVSDGAIFGWMDHDDFGRVTGTSNMSIPFGFAGGFYDGKTGLVRFGARDYDPETGRWTSKDPIGFNGGDTNLYGYTFSDPVNFIDPKGTDVTINYYGGGTGHIGISINGGPSLGYYGGFDSNSAALSGSNGEGAILSDFPRQGPPTTSVTLTSTPEQDKAMQDYLDNKTNNPGDYNLYSNNCTTNAANTLRAGGLNAPKTFIPILFINQLKGK